jgi:predicted lysophospholipase L1 biosynthesis ABC-type transport system permease subunit
MLGLFGGVVIGVAAGARRTDTVYPRFLRWSRAWDVAVPHFPAALSEGGNAFASVDLDQVEALPQVAESTRIEIYDTRGAISANAPLDASALATFDRPKVIEGRLPRNNAPGEIAMNWVRAESLGIHVGDTVRIRFPLFHPSAGHRSERLTFRVVGTEAQPGGFPPFLTDTPGALMSPGFAPAHRDLAGFPASLVRLQRGFADIPSFLDGLHRLAHHKVLFIERQDSQAANVQRSFHLQAIALWLLAGLTGLVAILVLGQTLARQTFLESDENPTLSSLGMTRSQLLGVAFLRAGIVAVVGSALALLVAVAASPLFPTGLARVAEPNAGFQVDVGALALGALLIVLVVLALSIPPTWRAAAAVTAREESAGGERPSVVAATLGRLGLPLSGAAGMRMALERGRGRTAVPVGTAVAGVTVGIAALAAALTFGASLTNLLETPRLYGLTWNLQIGTSQSFPGPDVAQKLEHAAKGDRRVAAFGLGTGSLGMSIDGAAVDGVAMFHDRGGVGVPVVAGRAPRTGHEIALGPKTLDQLHKEIGDTVRVGIFGSRPKPLHVVGEAIIPPVGDVGRFGEGALIDYRAAPYLVPGAPAADTLFVRTVPGADPRAVGDALARTISEVEPYVQLPSRPNDLVNFGRVQNFPVYLAALVALMAAATLAHVLVTSIRRRRRDLAILKTMGFERGQLRGTVAWQASTLAVVSLAIGLPLGIAAGRWVWSAFATSLGILPSPAVPAAAVALAIPLTVILANLIAFLPGRAAARVKPAIVLRTE